jgi:anti-sigma regulatory factor (Ser/Thr protein kinase)
MEVATRFRPADRDTNVGGDFFDVFRLGPNDWGLAIGDVCGKGARAAALSTLTRYTLRAAAVHQELPSDVLAEVNRVLATEPDADDRFCSAAFARLELDTCGAWVTLACAGHPRPIVVRRAGWIDHRGQPGTLLGMFDESVTSDDRVGLGPGDAIVFCTDGIIEARSHTGEMFGDDALNQLLLENSASDAETIASRVANESVRFAGGRSTDDVAVLVVRVPADAADDPTARVATATGAGAGLLPLPSHRVGEEYDGLRHARPAPPREARMRLEGDRMSAGAARRFLAGVLHSWRMSELVDGDVELLVSEVVSNATRHAGGGPVTVIVRYDGDVVRVEVGDGSRQLPQVLHVSPEATGGRGMFLVDQIASAWGAVPTVEGKRVWFEVPAPLPDVEE